MSMGCRDMGWGVLALKIYPTGVLCGYCKNRRRLRRESLSHPTPYLAPPHVRTTRHQRDG